MAEIKQTERAARILHIAWEYCQKDRNEFVTPEHLLLAMMRDEVFVQTLSDYCRPDKMADSLFREMIKVETVPKGQNYEPEWKRPRPKRGARPSPWACGNHPCS